MILTSKAGLHCSCERCSSSWSCGSGGTERSSGSSTTGDLFRDSRCTTAAAAHAPPLPACGDPIANYCSSGANISSNSISSKCGSSNSSSNNSSSSNSSNSSSSKMLAARQWGGVGGGADIAQVFERNQEATLYVGNIDNQVDEDLLWELFTQAGVVRLVNVPKDKVTGAHQGYAFVEFESETDADFALKLMGMVKLYGKPLRLSKAAHDRRTFDVGANLFVGNLDPDLDEKVLFDTFSSFGNVVSAKVMRDPETGVSKGFAFVSMESFEASDAALAAMNGQFLCNRPVHVSYAYKKDTRGERHGSAAERLLAANRPTIERPGGSNAPKEGPVPLQQQTPGAPPFGMLPGIGAGGPLPPLPLPMMGSAPGSLPPPPLFFMPRPGQQQQQEQQQQKQQQQKRVKGAHAIPASTAASKSSSRGAPRRAKRAPNGPSPTHGRYGDPRGSTARRRGPNAAHGGGAPHGGDACGRGPSCYEVSGTDGACSFHGAAEASPTFPIDGGTPPWNGGPYSRRGPSSCWRRSGPSEAPRSHARNAGERNGAPHRVALANAASSAAIGAAAATAAAA
ncbi:hypothetical protein Esti_004803 [Eimeria stiedai]